MKFSAKLWLRLDAKQMEMIDRFRVGGKRKTITVAIRHLIQKGLDLEAARTAREKLSGALCVLYDCDAAGLAQRLAELQLKAGDMVLSKTRVRLDSRLCLKVFAIRGSRKRIQGLLDRFLDLEGVKHAWFSECKDGSVNARNMRKVLTSTLEDNAWICADCGMVQTLPLVLTCGAERLWGQLNAILTEGHDIAVSFSVHLDGDAFLHVAVLRKPACGDVTLVAPIPEESTDAFSRGLVGGAHVDHETRRVARSQSLTQRLAPNFNEAQRHSNQSRRT
ncbi:MAG: hypothetical protein RDU24_09370 [Humidesulfovibrio sp.]|uniref:CopG family ribbon-helix-helix protein n=1 Tax=Humidesulfovibrio sp. TaxID=2910988 RepID=UPI0027EAF259|nr:hypothetical protein [Humidesulfovibrio sp.]MDQ7835577.1 hypothetical protein [Humidesulfovibrio sp.]